MQESKVVILYKSKYGSTEKYAQWISNKVGADIFKVEKIKIKNLIKYNTIVYCGGLYVGGILGFNFIKKNYQKLSRKKLIIVAVGATLKKVNDVEEVKNKNITNEMLDNSEFFILRGGLNYKKMNLIDKLLMFLLVKSIKMKKNQDMDNDSMGVLATYGKTVDFTNEKSIMPIINSINESLKQ